MLHRNAALCETVLPTRTRTQSPVLVEDKDGVYWWVGRIAYGSQCS